MRRRSCAIARFVGVVGSLLLVSSVPWSALPGAAAEPVDPARLGGRPTPAIPAPGSSTPPLVVAIQPFRSTTDPGLRVELAANVTGGVGPYAIVWSSSVGTTGVGANWSFASADPGNYSVTAYATDSAGHVASATASLGVASPLDLSIRIPTTPVDAGCPFPLMLSLIGGVPPYDARVTIRPTGSNESFAWSSGGNHTVVVSASAPGPATATVRVDDAVGGGIEQTTPVLDLVDPPLTVIFAPASFATEVAAPVRLLAVAHGGVAPLTWSLATASPLLQSSGVVGTVPADGTIHWAGSFGSAGVAVVVLTVIDGSGLAVTANVSGPVAPPLTAYLSTGPTSVATGGLVRVCATVGGGVAPYALMLVASDGEAEAANLSAPGAANWTVTPASAGTLRVSVRVLDAYLQSANNSTTVTVLASNAPGAVPPPLPAADASSLWLAGSAGVVLVAGLGAALLYPRLRRRRTAIDATSDPGESLARVRDLLQASEGLDRDTLFLLAEEQGVARASAEAALARWVRAGRVESGPSEGGADRLRWIEPSVGPSELEEVR